MPFIWMIWYRKCAVVNHSRPKRPDAPNFRRSFAKHPMEMGSIHLVTLCWKNRSSVLFSQKNTVLPHNRFNWDLMRVGSLFAKLLDPALNVHFEKTQSAETKLEALCG